MSDHEVSKPAQAHDVDDAVADVPEADAQGAAAAQADAAQTADSAAADATPDAAPATDADVTSDADALDTDADATPDATPDADAVPADAAPDALDTIADAARGRELPDHAAVAQSANESLAEAARAADEAIAPDTELAAPAVADKPAVDPDVAAFEEAETAFPGTFGGTFTPPAAAASAAATASASAATAQTTVLDDATALEGATTRIDAPDDARTQVLVPPPAAVVLASADVPPPIFVQAPEPPRERGNRGAIFGIGLLAAVGFAILYLGTALGIAAFNGKVDTDSIGTYLLDQLRSAGLWVPVVVFAIGFWLLGSVINRGRWGFWVIFGIIVGGFAYGGHLLGAIGSVEFWKLGGTQLADLVNGQLLAPLAIAAFIFGRELTIWFGAWAARTGARRTAQNEEAQREYERVLEAGPQLP